MLLFQFIVFNVLNVVIQTIKSIATIKCGKMLAAIVNAVAYGLYTYIIILTNVELNLWVKIIVVAVANLVGVYVVKLIEEKSRKDKLWLVKITVPTNNFEDIKQELNAHDISFNYYDLTNYFVIDSYCKTQKETTLVLNICKKYNGKAFATENKLSL